MNFSGSFHTVEYDMEAVLTVVFRISNPRYSFVPAGLEHDRLLVSICNRDDQADSTFGGFEYTVL